jgi:excinuclease ABC subunit C
MGFEKPLALTPLYSSGVLPLDRKMDFDAGRDVEFFTALPSRAGVMLLEMTDAAARPYLARTGDIRRAAERLLSAPEENSKRLNLRGVAARILYRVTGSKFEQSLALYRQARERFPARYRDLLRLRPPAVLKVNLRSQYPRCFVTRRIRADGGFYFGPFVSRAAADAFAQRFLDLFKIRRCQIKIRRDPSFPGCIYSEMKMCLAPCFAGCTKSEYEAELGRALATLNTPGPALIAKFEREREEASEALDYELAGALHKRMEKVSDALRGLPDVARRIDDLDGVILQRAAEEKAIAVFPLRGGLLEDPIFLRFGDISGEPRSIEAILRQRLQRENRPDEPGSVTKDLREAGHESGAVENTGTVHRSGSRHFGLRAAPEDLTEHLSLLARWFYSKPREGEILFRDEEWPYRRILRACGRLLASAEGTTGGPSTPT